MAHSTLDQFGEEDVFGWCRWRGWSRNRWVPFWYHLFMAMNLRVPEDLDRRLEKLAAEEHTSKSALLLQGGELVLQRHARRREISEGLDFVMSHDAELLTRLEDA